MTKWFFTIVLSFWALLVSAQNTFLKPVQVMGTGENTLNIIGDSFERYLISGGTTFDDGVAIEIDFYALCLNKDGDIIWEYYLPPVDGGLATFVGFYDGILEVDDGYLFLCYERPDASSDRDMILLKLDKFTGELLWLKKYYNNRREIGRSLIELDDGNIVIAGETRNNIDLSEISNIDAFLMKVDAQGNFIWKQTYDSGSLWQDVALTVLGTGDDGFAMCCYIDKEDFGNFEAYLIKTDSLGGKEWNFHHEPKGWSPDVQVIPSLASNLEGNLTLLSEEVDTDIGIDKMQLREFSLSGDTVDIKDLGAGDYIRTPNIIATADGNYISYTFANVQNGIIRDEMEQLTEISDRPLTFSKHTKSGQILWDRYYHIFGADVTVADICFVPWDGGIAATGFYVQEDATVDDPNSFILKLDENGCLDPENCGLYMWVMDDEVIDQSHLLSVGIEDFALSELKLHPNPASEKITIELPENGIAAHYLIHDLEGKQVMHTGKLANGTSELELDVSQYSSGIYILKLVSEQGEVLGGQRFLRE